MAMLVLNKYETYGYVSAQQVRDLLLLVLNK